MRYELKASIIGVLFLLTLVLFFVFYNPSINDLETACGDSICTKEEILSCCLDCGCSVGEVCNPNTLSCESEKEEIIASSGTSASTNTRTGCGNNICDRGENQWNCCSDCPCSIPNMECTDGSACELVNENSITDDQVILVFEQYLEIKFGEKFSSIEYQISESSRFGVSCSQICAVSDDNRISGECVCVSDSGDIISEIHII